MGAYSLPGAAVTTIDVALASAAPQANVTWAHGSTAIGSAGEDAASMLKEAQSLATGSDVAILVLGDIDPMSCGEWADRDSLDLPGDVTTFMIQYQ